MCTIMLPSIDYCNSSCMLPQVYCLLYNYLIIIVCIKAMHILSIQAIDTDIGHLKRSLASL